MLESQLDSADEESPAPGERDRSKTPLWTGVAGIAVGMVLGLGGGAFVLSGGDPTASSEYALLASELATVEEDLQEANEAILASDDRRGAAEDRVEELEAELDAAGAAESQEPAGSASAAYPSGDPVLAGYPVLIDTSSISHGGVARAVGTPKAVAVAPGVYSAYNPVVEDLSAYLELPNDGDCAVRDKYFPHTGGSCWTGVLPGSQEPAL